MFFFFVRLWILRWMELQLLQLHRQQIIETRSSAEDGIREHVILFLIDCVSFDFVCSFWKGTIRWIGSSIRIFAMNVLKPSSLFFGKVIITFKSHLCCCVAFPSLLLLSSVSLVCISLLPLLLFSSLSFSLLFYLFSCLLFSFFFFDSLFCA